MTIKHVNGPWSPDDRSPEKSGLFVRVKNFKGKSNLDQAIRQLNHLVNRENVLKELKKRKYFVSKGERKRLDKIEAISRRRKLERELAEQH